MPMAFGPDYGGELIGHRTGGSLQEMNAAVHHQIMIDRGEIVPLANRPQDDSHTIEGFDGPTFPHYGPKPPSRIGPGIGTEPGPEEILDRESQNNHR